MSVVPSLRHQPPARHQSADPDQTDSGADAYVVRVSRAPAWSFAFGRAGQLVVET